jgi:hypothetical protein
VNHKFFEIRGKLCHRFEIIYKTDRIKTHSSRFGGTFFLQLDRQFFFQSLGEKNKKQKFDTRNPGDTMGVSGYGSFFCLWAVRARSARGRVFTEPWATPLTAGAIKIERGVVYDPTTRRVADFFSTRKLTKREPQKRVARAQKGVVTDLP